MATIRSIRGGSAKLSEEDRITLATLLIKAGYTARIGYQLVPDGTKNKKEYVVEYWEGKNGG